MYIGQYQELRVSRESPHGLYLSNEAGEEVLLPEGQCPQNARMGDLHNLFVYTDSEDRPIATTSHPYAIVGEFAKLRAVSVSTAGAFLDWGLSKDLFCPPREQDPPMREGAGYVVRLYLDEVSQRVVCTNRINRFLRPDGEGLEVGQPVRIMVTSLKPEVISVIIDGEIKGSIFPDEWHERLEVGDVRDAFVKSIRAQDRKVAVSLRPQGYAAILGERERIISALKRNGGSLRLSDRSSPEDIHRAFGLSKGAFKKLIGALYRDGIIELGTDNIRLRT